MFPQQLGTVRGAELMSAIGKVPVPQATRAQANTLFSFGSTYPPSPPIDTTPTLLTASARQDWNSSAN